METQIFDSNCDIKSSRTLLQHDIQEKIRLLFIITVYWDFPHSTSSLDQYFILRIVI